jgi:tRNA(adenine34) deaminase
VATGPSTRLWETLAEPWRVCVEELWEGYCAGSPPHGAAVVGPQGQVLARGRNRQLEAPAPGLFLAGHRLAHAELSALLTLDERMADPRECVLYAANEPCPMCTGALAMSGIREVRYAARDAYGGAVALLDVMPIVRTRRIRVLSPHESGMTDLEAAVITFRVEWRLRRGRERSRSILEAAERIRPEAVRAAEVMAAGGELVRLAQRGAPAAVALEAVHRRLSEVA